MFAIQFHHDEELAAGAVVFSTLSSILTLPLYALLLTSVFAVQFGYDEDLAAGSVVITTFISIVVLPLCAMTLTMMM